MLKRLYYILLQRLYVSINKRKAGQGKVYMFHDVSDDIDQYCISKQHFNDLLEYLVKNRNIVDVDTFICEKDKNNVLITFDDAYESVFLNAYPILKKYDVPYYVFICNEYLNSDKYLKDEQIRKMLKDSKCVIGCHGYYHELSRFVDDDIFIDNLNKSKNELEKLFEIEIEEFAFPYGSMYACSKSNIEYAKSIFKHIYMTYALDYHDDYGNILPRININDYNYEREIL